jgi:ADP-dependent NAD(P)H-hydrate dehydratase / NAD(P)H-hydrate epimerase
MIPLFSTSQIREVDDIAIKQVGIPGIILMENAAIGIYNYLEEKILSGDKNKKLGFICGKGNNGGDGFAAARHCLNHGYQIKVLHFEDEDEFSHDCLINYKILVKNSEVTDGVAIKNYTSINDINWLKDCYIVIDAMLGSGAKGSLREPYKSIVERVNNFNSFKVAIDIPTGLDADTGYGKTVFNAALTITLGEFKKGLFFGSGAAYCGEVVKGSIGISESFYNNQKITEYLVEPDDVIDMLPGKKKNLHKYSAGKVLTIAGSGALPGAAVLTSKSALKIGAGASVLCFPKSVRKLVHKNLTEVVVDVYEDESKEHLTGKSIHDISKRIDWADVLAIGPGLGRNEETIKAVNKLIKKSSAKIKIIDADAVIALKGEYKNHNLKKAVLTPHHGEFSSLINISPDELQKDLVSRGRKFVEETGSYLVLKDAPSIIFLPSGEVIINSAGNPGMAKFGTGDVLTGVIAGLAAQLKNIEKAVIAGVYIHSLAADLLLPGFTEYGFTASDIIDNIPDTIKFLRKSFA